MKDLAFQILSQRAPSEYWGSYRRKWCFWATIVSHPPLCQTNVFPSFWNRLQTLHLFKIWVLIYSWHCVWRRSLSCKYIIEPWNCCNTAPNWGMKTFLMRVTWLFLSTLKSMFLYSWENIPLDWAIVRNHHCGKTCPFMFSCRENLLVCWKDKLRGWREGSMVKTITTLEKDPRSASSIHIRSSQLLVTPVPRNLTPSFVLYVHLRVHGTYFTYIWNNL